LPSASASALKIRSAGTAQVRDGNLAAFFEPAGNGIARNPEGTGKTPEAGALLVSAQDLLTPLWRVGVRAGLLAALPAAVPAAVIAEVLLFAVGSLAVLDDVFAFAVIAGDDSSNHSSILSFGLEPLPVFIEQRENEFFVSEPKLRSVPRMLAGRLPSRKSRYVAGAASLTKAVAPTRRT